MLSNLFSKERQMGNQ